MCEGNIFEVLSQDIQIPEIVQNKANEAFRQIRCEAPQSRKEENENMSARVFLAMGNGENLQLPFLLQP